MDRVFAARPGARPGLAFRHEQQGPYPASWHAIHRDSHGDIAVSPAGEIYVSVQGGDHPGIQVYSAAGRYLRNVPDAPPDLHGFIIARGPDRQPYIFGVSRLAQQIVKIALDGRKVLSI